MNEDDTKDAYDIDSDPKNVFVVYEDGTEIYHDIVEKSPEYLKVEKKVDKEAELRVIAQGLKGKMGECHSFWGEKKEILKKEYGIDWRCPAELNMILFD